MTFSIPQIFEFLLWINEHLFHETFLILHPFFFSDGRDADFEISFFVMLLIVSVLWDWDVFCWYQIHLWNPGVDVAWIVRTVISTVGVGNGSYHWYQRSFLTTSYVAAAADSSSSSSSSPRRRLRVRGHDNTKRRETARWSLCLSPMLYYHPRVPSPIRVVRTHTDVRGLKNKKTTTTTTAAEDH